ncbi:MAG: tRNA (N6-threonylcarbamoyladenosine(37)-N6)-methyltransferase TrmO [Clostridia bacterium]|nr:tRNA (N6-threonylcarbamoyladenosine(37)-N6)-methyltransferase TrmO [Clostridia bacterium]
MKQVFEPREIAPVGYVENDFKEKFGIPRQSGRTSLISRLVLKEEYQDENAFREIEGFSHLWLVFDFSKAREKGAPSLTVRPPRLGGNERVGVFASRSPFRPNFLGLSCVRLIRLEKSGNKVTALILQGADLLDGTPVYDIKPYLPHADCLLEARGGYADGVKDHRLQVAFKEELLALLPKEKRQGLIECLQDDPRPSYQEDGREYKMRFADWEIAFTVNGETLTVTKVEEA